LIGGKIDLDPLSLFPKKCKNHGRNGEEGQALQGQQWRRENGRTHKPLGKKGAFDRSTHEYDRCSHFTPKISRLKYSEKSPPPPREREKPLGIENAEKHYKFPPQPRKFPVSTLEILAILKLTET
jgi:hypothetical protein